MVIKELLSTVIIVILILFVIGLFRVDPIWYHIGKLLGNTIKHIENGYRHGRS